MTYYQKYRPQKVKELDLVDVRDNLLGALKSGELSHAHLFVGPRGSGKTSAARILSMAVNCGESASLDSSPDVQNDQKKKNGVMKLGEPCGKCKNCKEIKSGSAVDVLEMDAASHRGIDDIRSLKERIKLTPVSLAKKVYIIDEVHMLTKEAFNALLKVLEEPPKHVVFFLCTTELHKVPETIISRCAKLNFTKATEKEVESSLMKVIKGEKLKVEREAIELLARSVDGSFREGHKILQQLGISGKEITSEKVEKILGLAGRDDVDDLLRMSLEGRSKEIGGRLEKLEKKGIDAGNLLGDLLKSLLEMIRSGGEIKKEVRLAGLLIEASEKLKVSPLPFLPIELALLEVGLERKKKGGLLPSRTTGESRETPMIDDSTVKRDSSTSLRSGRNDKRVEGSFTRKVTTRQNGNILSLSKIEEEWGKLLDGISSKNKSIAGLLRASKPKVADGNNLTVEVFYEFHKSQLEQDSKRILVEQVAEELWGPTVLRCVLGDRPTHKASDRLGDRVVDVNKDDEYVKAAEDVFGS